MITININCSRIDKRYMFEGKNGKYVDLVLFENKKGKDRNGNDGMVVQGLPKEARDRGEKGEILGNWKHLKPRGAPTPSKPVPPPRADGTRY